MLTIRIASRSVVGARVRNEDDLRVGQRDGMAFAALSDGAGGHKDGAVASDLVVRVVAMALQAGQALQPELLHDAVHDAHELLLHQQEDAAEPDRMHATLVALWVDAAQALALWSHVGDSRLYLLRGGKVRHVTRDDSVVQQMVDAGLLSTEAAWQHPKKSHLVCAMGVESDFVAHTLVKGYPLLDEDAFLLCTDGWWDPVGQAGIERALADAGSADDWLTRMETLIREQALSDQDNYSAIAVWVGAEAPSRDAASMEV